MMRHRLLKRAWLSLLCLALLLPLAGCGPAAGVLTAAPAAPPPNSPEPPPIVEPAAGSDGPTSSPEPTAIVEPSPTPESAEEVIIQLFLVAMADEGQAGPAIGCGDSIVPIERQIVVTGDPVVAALEELLALDGPYYGGSGLYNSLYHSTLQVESVARDGDTVTVRLTGDFLLGGVCDNPRAEAQVVETVRHAAGVEAVEVYVNGTPLRELLSGKG